MRVGDIIKVQHGELAPADMILLDSNNIRDKLPICYLNVQNTEGKENLKEVKSTNLTRSTLLFPHFIIIIIINYFVFRRIYFWSSWYFSVSSVKDSKKSHFNKYKTRLHLKLMYETPNNDYNKFVGQLRLKKDPKIEELTAENFIPRGSHVFVNKPNDWYISMHFIPTILFYGLKKSGLRPVEWIIMKININFV